MQIIFRELRKIDNLWLKYSKSKFGISVQQRIYKNLGKTEQFNASVWRQFGSKVGWIKSSSWLDYNKLNFSVNAPAGHLPIILDLLGNTNKNGRNPDAV